MSIKQKVTVEDDFSKTLDKFNEKAKQSDGSTKKLDSSLGAMAKTGGIAVAAISATALALLKMADNTASVADDLDESSQKLGVSLKFYQQIGGVAKRSGTDIGALTGAMRALVATSTEASTKGGEAGEAYKKIGVNVVDASGKMKSQEVLLKETLLALSEMPAGIERAAIAQKLFGRSAAELNPVLNLGKTKLSEYTSEMSTSVTVTEELARVSSDYKDNMATIGEIAQKTVNSGLLPVITVMEGISGLIVKMNQDGEFDTLGKDIADIGILAAESFKVVGWGLAEIAIIGEGVVGYFETAGTGIAKVTLEVASAMASLNAWKIKNESSVGGDPLKSAKYIEAKAFADEMKASLNNINTELDDTITKHGGRIESLKGLQKKIMGLSVSGGDGGQSSGGGDGGGGDGGGGGTTGESKDSEREKRFNDSNAKLLQAQREYDVEANKFHWESQEKQKQQTIMAIDAEMAEYEEYSQWQIDINAYAKDTIAQKNAEAIKVEAEARESIKNSAFDIGNSIASIASSNSSIRLSEINAEIEAVKKSSMTDAEKAKSLEALEKKRREETLKSAKTQATFNMTMAAATTAMTIAKSAQAIADVTATTPGGPFIKIASGLAVGASLASVIAQAKSAQASIAGAREHGGGAMGGNSYAIGEKGKAEIVDYGNGSYVFNPASSATVTPIADSGMGGKTINATFHIYGASDANVTGQTIVRLLKEVDRDGSMDWNGMTNLKRTVGAS